MKKALLILSVWLLPIGLFAQQGNDSQQKALVFTNVTVIDATGAPARVDMSVIIRADRIETLCKSDSLVVPSDAKVVDARGKFLIPGLWDMHAHPNLGKDYLALFTANGVTGIRVMYGRQEYHHWRKEISAGKLIGPRMVISSPAVGFGPDNLLDLRNEEEARQFVRKVKAEGADFVKVKNHILRDVFFVIADEAKKQRMPFAGHVPLSITVVEASDAGQRSIEHGYQVARGCSSVEEDRIKAYLKGEGYTGKKVLETYGDQKAAALFARLVENRTWVCPTILVETGSSFWDGEDLANDTRLQYMPVSYRNRWNLKINAMVALVTGEGRAACKKWIQKKLEVVAAMRGAGVGLLAGTDTPIPFCLPGFGLHDELVLFVRAGLSPMEALRTATYNPAKYFGQLDSMGTIEQGKIADMVLLEANPLENISNTQKIAGVVFGGRFFDKAGLQKMLAQVEAARLHEAAAAGNIEDVKVLISEDTDVNARNLQGLTPASIALDACELAVVDLLVEKGADTTTPHLAAYTGDLRSIKSLQVEKDDPTDSLEGLTLLHAAAAGGHIDVVEYLIAKGFEATVTTEDNKTTPLHLAAASGHEEVAKLLIDKGANVNAKDGRGHAPLHLAAQYGDIKVAQALLSEGADPNQENSNGMTPLQAAAGNGHRAIAELLIETGAEVNQEDSEGETPLHQAAWNGHSDIAELLIEAGAEVNEQKNNKWGETPLHYATWAGHKDVAGLLIGKGANVNARNNEQNTPLYLAANRGHKDVLELLLAKGADVNAKNRRGENPLSLAKAKGDKEIAELLRKHGAKE